MNEKNMTRLDVGTTDAEVLRQMAVVLNMVEDFFVMDRGSELARMLHAMVATCYEFGSRTAPATDEVG